MREIEPIEELGRRYPLDDRKPRSRVRDWDVALGLVLPWAMLFLDRFLFGGSEAAGSFDSVLGDWRPAAYSGTAGFTVALGCWLARGRAPGLQAGILGAGATFALAVGVCLLPPSLIGVFFILGVLGFSPFLMAWSYYRCARDAWRLRAERAVLPALLGFVLALSLPLCVQLAVERTSEHALALVRADDPAGRERGMELFRHLRQVRNLDELVLAYQDAEDDLHRQRLGEAFQQVTGREIEGWLAMRYAND
jgi:hypothetical protein